MSAILTEGPTYIRPLKYGGEHFTDGDRYEETVEVDGELAHVRLNVEGSAGPSVARDPRRFIGHRIRRELERIGDEPDRARLIAARVLDIDYMRDIDGEQ